MPSEWITPVAALKELQCAGLSPPNAWSALAKAMQGGFVRCLAGRLEDDAGVHLDTEVPWQFWIYGNVPPPGHTFWRNGDAMLEVALPGSASTPAHEADPFLLAAPAPQVIIRSAQLDAKGVEALVEACLPAGEPPLHRNKEVGPPPPDDVITSKLVELLAKGLNRDEAAKAIRQFTGFERVGNEHARRLLRSLRPRGRPKKRV